MTIQRGDLIFVKNKGFLFDKIRKLLNCEYDHIGIMLTDNTLIDATPFKGVAVRSLKEFYNCNVAFYRLKEDYRKHIEDMLSYCSSNVGCKYDLLQIISLYFLIIFNIKKTFDPLDIARAFVCSELIAQAAEFSGFKFNSYIATDRLTPTDIQYSEVLERV